MYHIQGQQTQPIKAQAMWSERWIIGKYQVLSIQNKLKEGIFPLSYRKQCQAMALL